MNSPPDPLDPYKKAIIIANIKATLAIIEAMPVQKSCATCNYFEQDGCQLWNASPPPDIRANGCESWKFDDTSPPF